MMDLDEDEPGDSQPLDGPLPAPSAESVVLFEQTLSKTTCPSCKALSGCIRGDEKGGARCEACGWGIEAEVLGPLSHAFAAHHR